MLDMLLLTGPELLFNAFKPPSHPPKLERTYWVQALMRAKDAEIKAVNDAAASSSVGEEQLAQLQVGG